MENSLKGKLGIVLSMLIFGTIGVVKRFIPLSSSFVAFIRAALGVLTLMLIMLLFRKRPDIRAIKGNIIILLSSGIVMGFNWVLLFEAYNYTSVASATLAYYMAPIFVMIFSPLLLGASITKKSIGCILVALFGMVLVSGVLDGGSVNPSGIILGLCAALLYATVIILNKRLKEIDAYDRTLVQLLSAGAVMLIYALLFGGFDFTSVGENNLLLVILLVLCIGIIHTGLAYALYFGSMQYASPNTIAILSYVDPALAVILSATLLCEPITPLTVIGAALILGASFVSEVDIKSLKIAFGKKK